MKKLFNKSVIGMIHIHPLPGTPNYSGNLKSVIDTAIEEAEIYQDSGIDAIMIENMHDVPYLKRNVGPEIISVMAVIANEIKMRIELPMGIQILAGANKEALSVALAADLQFIRAEGFVFSHIGDEGTFDSDAGELLRFRKNIEAKNILILTDIKKKHSSHSITSDYSISETAKAAEFFQSDGLIVTGQSTGIEPALDELKEIRNNSKLPILIGSGITIDNIERYFNLADSFIVGSHFKDNGDWKNAVEKIRVAKFLQKIITLKKL